jgi:hypothetical protein
MANVDNKGLVTLEEKDVYLHFTVFQLRIYMNKYMLIRNEKILQCVSYVLRNVRALNYLFHSELLSELTYTQHKEIMIWTNKNEVL